MTKTMGILALVAMALIAISAVDADAHWTIVSGKLVYHSLDCTSVIKDWDPADTGVGVCRVTVTAADIRCYNPNGSFNDKGSSFNPIPLPPVEGDIGADQITKKGKSVKAAGHLTAEVLSGTGILDLPWDVAGCPNSNWSGKALIRNADLVVDVYECNPDVDCSPLDTTPDETYTYSAKYACTLSPTFTFDNPPPAGTSMSCTTVSTCHVDAGCVP